MMPAMVVLLQVVIPVVLIARLFHARRLSLPAWMLFFVGTVSFIAGITVAGLWLALPWYTGLAYLLIVALAVVWRSPDVRGLRWRPQGRFAWAEIAICAVFVVGAGTLFVLAVASRRAPDAAAVNLAFPLNGGSYYVASGGGRELTNAHAETLAENARPYRGQSYAVDVVRLDDVGLRSGAFPLTLNDYRSVGEPVLSPCDGHVLQVENAAPDMIPPIPDPARLAGNYVLLECGAVQVFLGHLKQGSVAVERGQRVRALERIGAIGNSGNSEEPHLHIHAQRAAVAGAASMFDGRPIPMTFYGRALARNDIVRTAAVPPPAMTESELLYGQLGSTIVALLMLLVSVRRRQAGVVLFSLLFAWAAVVNARTAWSSPMDYLGYAAFALSDLYRAFILGFFAQHAGAIVLTIAACQAGVAAAVLAGGRWRRIGLAGAITFFIGIAPLGVGSGLPATLILALGAGVLWPEPVRRGRTIEIVAPPHEVLRRAA